MRFYAFIFLLSNIVFAQKEADIWYFGQKCGLDFSTGEPKILTNSSLETDEGCSVICDKNGKLLFYTDGITVWNSEHKPMYNGQDLSGHPSSTQSGIAIAKPNDSLQYYLFTTHASGLVEGLQYSLINMSMNKGKGDIVKTEKNVRLASPVTEKLTAVKHRNGIDIWVICHMWKSDLFFAYLVTEKGVNQKPIVSKSGKIHTGNPFNAQGYMKSNPDGSNLALALEGDDVFEIFDFDNESGKVSNPITLEIPKKSCPYGVEFSPNGSIFYGSAAATGEIYQFNLQAGSILDIQNSIYIAGKSEENKWIGALQIANNGKIYFPIFQTTFLGVINNPNKLGYDCGYENNEIDLERYTTLGLPSFIQSYFLDEVKNEVVYFEDKKIEKGKSMILNNITFEFNSYKLNSNSYPELQKIVKLLQTNPNYKIELIGHTDNIGNKSTNIELSKNRAKAIKDYLVLQKIDEKRITFQGKGSLIPISENETETGRKLNRRVEFILKQY